MPSVDYDNIININTLTWFNPDLDLIFDRANHIDCDMHISLLFDVGSDDPEEYTSVRVGYPANKEDRLGFITPPASPRKYKEETLSNIEHIDSRQYIGNVSSVPTSTDKGIKQTLKLKNITGVSEVSILDSPIADGNEEIIDATSFVEYVNPIKFNVSSSKRETYQTLFDKFNKYDYITDITDDIYFDSNTGLIEGTIYIHYDIEKVHISKSSIQFFHGLDPEYKIYGIGSNESAKSPLKIHIKQKVKRKEVFLIKNKAGLRIYIFINDKQISSNLSDYRWITLDYGFNDTNWRTDKINNISLIFQDMWSSRSGIPSFYPDQTFKTRINFLSENTLSIYNSWITSSINNNVFIYSFGTVISGIFDENINFMLFTWLSSQIFNNVTYVNMTEAVLGYYDSDYVDLISLSHISSNSSSISHLESWIE